MKIIACVKAVPEEQDIVVTKSQELSFDKAAWKISAYDLNAIETGKGIIAEVGGTMTGLSLGGAALNNTKLKKDILSRGLDDLTIVLEEERDLTDSFEIASGLKNAIEKMDSYDLVLCGVGSGDLYSQEVGNILGGLLDVPVLNDVSKVTPGDGVVVVERTIGSVVDVLEVALPAVISVTPDINIPSIPAMKDILKAGKKPVATESESWDGIEKGTEIVSELAPSQKERAKVVVEGDDDESIEKLIAFLKKEMA